MGDAKSLPAGMILGKKCTGGVWRPGELAAFPASASCEHSVVKEFDGAVTWAGLLDRRVRRVEVVPVLDAAGKFLKNRVTVVYLLRPGEAPPETFAMLVTPAGNAEYTWELAQDDGDAPVIVEGK